MSLSNKHKTDRLDFCFGSDYFLQFGESKQQAFIVISLYKIYRQVGLWRQTEFEESATKIFNFQRRKNLVDSGINRNNTGYSQGLPYTLQIPKTNHCRSLLSSITNLTQPLLFLLFFVLYILKHFFKMITMHEILTQEAKKKKKVS